jgi:hypothetical protein
MKDEWGEGKDLTAYPAHIPHLIRIFRSHLCTFWYILETALLM